ncbi:hypothetical protein IQ06DRAFT_57996 [Phaeosphaeriaceae sp. SRC1lsM3a]|nr:hypothetical protein IQ06DRAFT_57996 [Stagonospora sp. SRC1lsM3a]
MELALSSSPTFCVISLTRLEICARNGVRRYINYRQNAARHRNKPLSISYWLRSRSRNRVRSSSHSYVCTSRSLPSDPLAMISDVLLVMLSHHSIVSLEYRICVERRSCSSRFQFVSRTSRGPRSTLQPIIYITTPLILGSAAKCSFQETRSRKKDR